MSRLPYSWFLVRTTFITRLDPRGHVNDRSGHTLFFYHFIQETVKIADLAIACERIVPSDNEWRAEAFERLDPNERLF